MARHTRIGILIGLLAALPLIGLAGIAIFVKNHQSVMDESELYSATALPFTNEQLTQTAYQLIHDLTALPDQSVSCGWQWATQPDEALTRELQTRLTPALNGIYEVRIRAEIFGENCLNNDGSVRYFVGMQTDFQVNIQLQSWEANNPTAVDSALSALVREVLAVLADYPPEVTAGPNAGHIRIDFSTAESADNGVYSIWIGYVEAMNALDQHLTGTALLEALHGTPQ